MGACGWWLQRYLESEKFKNTLEQKFSQALNTSFSLQELAFDPFSGFTLGQVKITDPPPHNGEDFLTIDQVILHYDPWGLFDRKLLLNKLKLHQPKATLRFYPDGGWNVPRLAAAAPKNGIWMDLEEFALQLELMLKEYQIEQGDFEIINAEKKSLCRLHGIDLQGDYHYGPRGAEANGKLTVPELELHETFKIEQLASSLSYGEKKLTLPAIQGIAYGGEVTGLAELDFSQQAPSFRLNLKLTDAELAALNRALEAESDWLDGVLELSADLKGALSNPLGLVGDGRFNLQKIKLTKLKWAKEMAQILWVPELEKIEFDYIRGTFKVEDQKIAFYNVEASSTPLEITGTGTVTFDRRVEFDIGLAISPTLCASMPKEVIAQLPQRQDQYRTLAFHVSGTLSQPKTNLTEKLARNALQQGAEKLGSELEDKLKEKSPKLYQLLFPSKVLAAPPASAISPEAPEVTIPPSPSTQPSEEKPQNPSTVGEPSSSGTPSPKKPESPTPNEISPEPTPDSDAESSSSPEPPSSESHEQPSEQDASSQEISPESESSSQENPSEQEPMPSH